MNFPLSVGVFTSHRMSSSRAFNQLNPPIYRSFDNDIMCLRLSSASMKNYFLRSKVIIAETGNRQTDLRVDNFLDTMRVPLQVQSVEALMAT